MTLPGRRKRACKDISTHILTKRMTSYFPSTSTSLIYFNSHPHEEDDLPLRPLYHTFYISTHILTKRMTIRPLNDTIPVLYFNSHPHEEDDRFTAPFMAPSKYFNSHPHEEDDRVYKTDPIRSSISTHILTKRMTVQQQHQE